MASSTYVLVACVLTERAADLITTSLLKKGYTVAPGWDKGASLVVGKVSTLLLLSLTHGDMEERPNHSPSQVVVRQIQEVLRAQGLGWLVLCCTENAGGRTRCTVGEDLNLTPAIQAKLNQSTPTSLERMDTAIPDDEPRT